MLTGLHSVVAEAADFEAAVRDAERLFARTVHIGSGAHGASAVGGATGDDERRSAFFAFATGGFEIRSARRMHGETKSGLVGLRLWLGSDRGARLAPGWLESSTIPIELVADPSPSGPPAAPLVAQADAVADGAIGAVEAEEVGRVLGLDHVVIATRAPERLRRLLADELGLRLALDRTFPERRLRLLFFRIGGITLEVATPAAPEPDADGPPGRVGAESDAGRDGFGGLAWKVAGLDPLRARLQRDGFDVSAIRPGFKPATRVCSVRAPVHGVPTLLIEHPPASAQPTGSPP